jgi:hypothetical protein
LTEQLCSFHFHVAPLVHELSTGSGHQLLSRVQAEILPQRRSSHRDWTDQRIQTAYKLGGPSVALHSFPQRAERSWNREWSDPLMTSKAISMSQIRQGGWTGRMFAADWRKQTWAIAVRYDHSRQSAERRTSSLGGEGFKDLKG